MKTTILFSISQYHFVSSDSIVLLIENYLEDNNVQAWSEVYYSEISRPCVMISFETVQDRLIFELKEMEADLKASITRYNTRSMSVIL